MAIRPSPLGDSCGALNQHPISDPSLARASPRYFIEPVTIEEGLSNLEADWNSLSQTAELPNVFTTFDWFRAWNGRAAADDQGKRRSLEVLVLRRDGAVAGISPLIRRTVSRFGLVVRKVEFLESPADYNDLALGDDPAGQIEAIVTYLKERQDHWDIADLRNLRSTGNTMRLIERALSKTDFMYRILSEARCPYFPIDSNWLEMSCKLSGSMLRTLRNQNNRLARMYAKGLRIRIIDSPQNEPGLLDKLIAIESQKRIQGELVPPFFARFPEVFQSLFDTLGPRRWFYIALMELEGRPLAWQLGFRCGKQLWDFSKAYDQSYSRLSPGTMLIPAVIDYGFANGFKEYDFLRGEESYKMHWSTGCHETSRLVFWNRRWMSCARAFLYLDFKPTVYRAIGQSGP